MIKDQYKEKVGRVSLKAGMTVNELVGAMAKAGSFGGGRLAEAVDIYERMLREDAFVMLGLAGAMVPAGMKGIIVDMINKGMVNAIVSTGANMVHDTLEAFGGCHFKGVVEVDDKQLYSERVDRIYDIFIPEEIFVKSFDKPILEVFKAIHEANEGQSLSSAEFMREVGKRVPGEDSILKAAYKRKVPVFVPALQDSCFGLSMAEFTALNGGVGVVVDAFKEINEYFNLIKNNKRNGAFLVGGGVPKNFIFQAAFKLKHPYGYVIQITTDRPEPGGLSGATLDEAVSWGKVAVGASKVQVISDATICFPLIVAAVMERLAQK